MRRALSITLMIGVVLTSLPALAQHRGGGGGGRGMPARQGQQPGPQQPRGPAPQQPGRMSEAERQQLRRDITDHGREVYRDRGAARKQGGNPP
jgi:hypothetical protein